VLYNFQGAAAGDGYYPAAGLLVGNGGALYGTTPVGGIEGWGTVFRLSPAAPAGPSGGNAPGGEWTETVKASFNLFDGANPAGAMALGPLGALYGSTQYGGSAPCAPQDILLAFCGTIFEVTP
jgi:uncharacterized repeat protein (TIGR03803 family)